MIDASQPEGAARIADADGRSVGVFGRAGDARVVVESMIIVAGISAELDGLRRSVKDAGERARASMGDDGWGAYWRGKEDAYRTAITRVLGRMGR